MPVRAVIGLGNPGVRYEGTRHNLGFHISESFLRREKGGWDHDGLPARWGWCREQSVIVAHPLTMMNRSGAAITALVRRFALRPDEIVVVCDDLDLPLGRLRLRPSGSDGGHRGLASIQHALASQEFGRLRAGIGRPPQGMGAASYVLTPFSRSEEPVVEQVTEAAVAALGLLLDEGYETAMNRYNGWQAEDPAVG